MRQEHDAEQHRHPGRAKEGRDEAAGEWNGGKPEQPEQAAQGYDRCWRYRQKQKTKEDDGSTEIDEAQAAALFDEATR